MARTLVIAADMLNYALRVYYGVSAVKPLTIRNHQIKWHNNIKDPE